MYKVFSGTKCIQIKENQKEDKKQDSHVIVFTDAQSLHKAYNHFMHRTKLTNLIILGQVESVWRVFRSLFNYIEAAGGMVTNDAGELLMIYRNKHWDLPKGKIEANESPEEASVREVEEECGLKYLKLKNPILNTYHTYLQNQKENLKCTYWYSMECNDQTVPTPQTEEGIEEVKWLNKSEVQRISDKMYDSVLAVIETSSFLSR